MRIDFDGYIAERTEDFSPRPWLFEKIGAWLASPGGSRYCLITAEPGGGKTAVAAQVCNASRGRLAAGVVPVPPGSIDAYHFCVSQDAGWIDPLEFSHSVSSQLAASVPGFDEALREVQTETRHITAAPNITIAGDVAAGANVKGVDITVKGGSPQATFIREVRNPLVKLYADGLARDVVILVDALDEARLVMAGETTILDLIASLKQSLPRVRFLVTARPEPEIIRTLEQQDPELLHFALSRELREKSRDDVSRYVAATLPKTTVAGKLAPDLTPAAFAGLLAARADGNFLWVRMALAMLNTATEPVTAAMLEAIPPRLRSLYFEFIERIARKDRARWRAEHARVLGTLVAAQEDLPAAELARYSGLDDATLAGVIRDVDQLLDKTGHGDGAKYSIYHRSFSDFLVDRDAAQEYFCDLGAQHRRIVEVWLHEPWASSYALRHIAAHLFALRGDAAMRQRLYALATRELMDRKSDALGSDASFANDVSLVAEAAAEAGDLAVEIRATSILTALRSRAASVPAALLALLARLGDLHRVRAYLSLPLTPRAKIEAVNEVAEALLDRDPGAAEALLLEAIAAAPSEPDAARARALRVRAIAELGRFDELPSLRAEIDTHVDDRIVKVVAGAGRYELAEQIAGWTDGYRQETLLAAIAQKAVARGDFDEARRRVSALSAWVQQQVVESLARAQRAGGDPAEAIAVAAMAEPWRRTTILTAVAMDAARDSEDALARFMAVLPGDDRGALRDAAIALADAGDIDAATRLARHAGGAAMEDVDARRVRMLVRKGALAEAHEMAGASSHLRREFAVALAAHARAGEIAPALDALESWQIGPALEVVARERDPELGQQVLHLLRRPPMPRDLMRVAEIYIERSLTGPALQAAAMAPGDARIPVMRAIAAAAIQWGNAEAAWRAYEASPEAIDAFAEDVIELQWAGGREDRALKILHDPRAGAGVRARRAVVDRRLIRDAVDAVITASIVAQDDELDDLLVHILVNDWGPSFDRTLSAVRWKRPDNVAFQTIAERAARELAARKQVDRVEAIAGHAPDGNPVLARAAVELLENGDAADARRLIPLIQPEPAVSASLALAARDDAAAALAALRALLAIGPGSLATETIAAMAVAAIDLLPGEESSAVLRTLAGRLELAEVLEKAARGGRTGAGMAIARSLAASEPALDTAGDRAIDALSRMLRWEAAAGLAMSLPQPKSALERVLRNAGAEKRLADAVIAARAQSPALVQEILQSYFANHDRLDLRVQALDLLGDDARFKRGRVVDELCARHAFEAARDSAGSDEPLLAAVVAGRAAAGKTGAAEWARAMGITDATIWLAVERLVEKGLTAEAADCAKTLRDSWEWTRLTEALAARGDVGLALELAENASGWRQSHAFAKIAVAVAAKDPEQSLRIVGRISRSGMRAEVVAEIIAAVAAAGDVDAALSILRRSKLVPTSVTALTRVASALFAAGRTDEARSVVSSAVQLVDSVDDRWERNAAIHQLAAQLIRRAELDDAQRLADLLPVSNEWRVSTLLSVADARLQRGDRAAALATVGQALEEVRQCTNDDDAVTHESTCLALLAAAGTTPLGTLVADAVAAKRANPSLVPFILVDLTYKLGTSRWLPPQPKFGPFRKLLDWWRRWRVRRQTLRLLALAREVADRDPDPIMKTQALASIAARDAELERFAEAIELAGAVERETRPWPPSTARIYARATIGLVYAKADPSVDPMLGELFTMVAERSDDEHIYGVRGSVGSLLHARGARTDDIEAAVAGAQRSGEPYIADHFLIIATAAIGDDPERARRVGNVLGRAAQEAMAFLVRPLCDSLLRCGEVAGDRSFFQEARMLSLRLERRDEAEFLPTYARRIAKTGDGSAREWVDAALDALTASADDERAAARRAVVADALRILGAPDEARRQMAIALRESRNATREAFFAVVDAIALNDDVPGIARAILETEGWWPHRSRAAT